MTDQHDGEAIKRRDKLEKQLRGETWTYWCEAKWRSLLIVTLIYGSYILGGLAAAIGITGTSLLGIAAEHVVPLVSVLSLLSTLSIGLVRLTQLRPHADWCYEVRDEANRLRNMLLYELPEKFTCDDVKTISERWSKTRGELGLKATGINAQAIDNHLTRTAEVCHNRVPREKGTPEANTEKE